LNLVSRYKSIYARAKLIAKTHAKDILISLVSTDSEQVLVRGYRYWAPTEL